MKFFAFLSILSAATLVQAGTFHSIKKGATNIIPDAYIIEYDDGVHHESHSSLLNTRSIHHDIRKRYDIFHGAAVDVKSGHSGEQIAEIPGVKNVWHVTVHNVPKVIKATQHITDPEAVSPHHMTGVDVAHRQYKLTGKGIKIGVIDTGIDYRHPAFASPGKDEGCFGRHGKSKGKSCRVAYGWDFVGDDYDGYNQPNPDDDPMDCYGHGTHVAGIIGANALNISSKELKPPQPFVGVAPEVTLGAYRVYGCKGGASDDVILAAMEMAFDDGMDVINMSLGGGSAYKYNPQASLAEKLISKGMAVAAAAGNDGHEGAWMVADAGLGDSTTSVASFENLYGLYYAFKYAGKIHPYAPSEGYGDKALNLPASSTLIPLLDEEGILLDGCDDALYKNTTSKVVLLLGDASNCDFKSRAAHAKKAGAVGILIQSIPSAITQIGGNFKFPIGSIENKAGLEMIEAYNENSELRFSWNNDPVNFVVQGGGAPSAFSSLGMDGELRSKPDISAPGGNILSTYPLAKGGYTLMSGTSMATPYIAGAQALYMQSKKSKVSGRALRLILKNTATISKTAGSKTLASAAKQGAGLVHILNAIRSTATISPDHIDLRDSMHLPAAFVIYIQNTGKVTETYTLSHKPADTLALYDKNSTFPRAYPVVYDDYATVYMSKKKVKIAPGKTVQVQLVFKRPTAVDEGEAPLYSGYIVATPSSKNGVAVHVPYTGLSADAAKVPIMDTDSGLPKLMYAADGEFLKEIEKETMTFDMATQIPVIVTRLGSHTPDLSIRILDADTKIFRGFAWSDSLGPAFGWSGRDKDLDDNGLKKFGTWMWSGHIFATKNMTTPRKQLPAGTYNIVIAAQRKLSMGVYPDDYEVYDLGDVTIKRRK
ncbi:hypothetical protein BGZ67_007259 [Mortierella alpina]|nr:hypothetical protein BGZ67_007259 [Mortierella alpina]